MPDNSAPPPAKKRKSLPCMHCQQPWAATTLRRRGLCGDNEKRGCFQRCDQVTALAWEAAAEELYPRAGGGPRLSTQLGVHADADADGDLHLPDADEQGGSGSGAGTPAAVVAAGAGADAAPPVWGGGAFSLSAGVGDDMRGFQDDDPTVQQSSGQAAQPDGGGVHLDGLGHEDDTHDDSGGGSDGDLPPGTDDGDDDPIAELLVAAAAEVHTGTTGMGFDGMADDAAAGGEAQHGPVQAGPQPVGRAPFRGWVTPHWQDRGPCAVLRSGSPQGKTVEQVAAQKLQWKLRFRISNEAFVLDLCHTAATLPNGSLYPTTLSQVLYVLGLAHVDPRALRVHACLNRMCSGGLFVDGKCPICGDSLYLDPAAVPPVPRVPFMYVFPLATVVQRFFMRQAFVDEHNGNKRDSGFWASPYFALLTDEEKSKMMEKDAAGNWVSVVLMLGGDDINLHSDARKKIGGVFVRPVDVDGKELSRDHNCSLVALAPVDFWYTPAGRRQVSTRPPVGRYLAGFLDAVKRSYTVPIPIQTSGGGVVYKRVFILFGMADAPWAAVHLFCGQTHGGYFPCTTSLFTGIYEGDHIRYLGYSEPQPQNTYLANGGVTLAHHAAGVVVDWRPTADGDGVHAEVRNGVTALLVNDAQQADHALLQAAGRNARAMILEGRDPKQKVPCVQDISIFDGLPCVRLHCAPLLPVYHLLAYGVARTFFWMVCPTDNAWEKLQSVPAWMVSFARREVMRDMGAAFKGRMPSGSSRDYSCYLEYSGLWTMEDWTLFAITISPILFKDAWAGETGSKYYKMVVLFSYACRDLFNSRATLAETRRGAQFMLEFAKLGEQLYRAGALPAGLFTYNLSMAVSQLHRQHERTNVPPARINDCPIERAERVHLKAPAEKTTTNCEVHIMKQQMMHDRLQLAVRGAEAPPASAARQHDPRRIDESGADGEFWCSSVPLKPLRDEATLGDIKLYMDDVLGDEGAAQALQMNNVLVSATAHHGDGFELRSVADTRTKKRQSTHVAIGFNEAVAAPKSPRTRLDEAAAAAAEKRAAAVGSVQKELIGQRIVHAFRLKARGTKEYCGVVTGGRDKHKWLVRCHDGKIERLTELQVRAGMTLYASRGEDVLTVAEAEQAAQPVRETESTEYAEVQAFYKVTLADRVWRLAMVKTYECVTRPSSDLGRTLRAYATVDLQSVHNHIGMRVVPLETIQHLCMLIPLPPDHGTAGVGVVAAAPRMYAAVAPVLQN